MPVYRVDRVMVHTKKGGSLFWFIETYHETVEDLCEDLRKRKIVTVTQLITERGEAGFAIVVGRVDLGISLASVDCITVPSIRFVESDSVY